MSHLTEGGAKEMLPVAGKPVILRVIQEAREAGADKIIVVSSPSKPDLNRFIADLPKEWPEVELVMQDQPIGLGPAVAQALADEPCLILLPDSFFHPSSPSARLAQLLCQGGELAIAFRQVPDELVSRYGIAIEEKGGLLGLIEKPALADAPSRWAVNGRYAFSAASSLWIKNWIESHLPSQGERELPLTPAIQELLKQGVKGALLPVRDEENRYDCGSPEGYRLATEVFA
jgi:UTP--glucose-1-phosphate uridylyltransferase